MPIRRGRRCHAARLALLIVGLLALSACQAQVTVDTVVLDDGSGVVTVAVGLDEAALRRVGDLSTNLQVEDLRATGWTVNAPEPRADGTTWVTATRPFATPEEGTAVLRSLNPEVFRGMEVRRDTPLGRTDWSYSGTVDLRGGLASFSDAEVAAQLGGDPLGGNVAAIEQEEGRPAAEMVRLEVSATLPEGASQRWQPALTDPAPTTMSLTASRSGPIPIPRIGPDGGSSAAGLAVVVVVLLAVAVVVVALLRRRAAAAYHPGHARTSPQRAVAVRAAHRSHPTGREVGRAGAAGRDGRGEVRGRQGRDRDDAEVGLVPDDVVEPELVERLDHLEDVEDPHDLGPDDLDDLDVLDVLDDDELAERLDQLEQLDSGRERDGPSDRR